MWLSAMPSMVKQGTGVLPQHRKNKNNELQLKKKKKVSNGRWPQKGHRDTGAGAASSPCSAPGLSGQREPPQSAASSVCHTWIPRHLPRPNSAQAPTPRPSEGRGGPQEPVLRPAGSAGGRRGARRTGRPPWGGSPGSQAWRGLQTQTPGAGSQRSALNCRFPFFFHARTLKPYLGPVPTKQREGVAGEVGAT